MGIRHNIEGYLVVVFFDKVLCVNLVLIDYI